MGEKFEQRFPQAMERLGQATGQLRKRGLQLALAASIDYAQHRFGLHQIDASGEEGTQREFSRLG